MKKAIHSLFLAVVASALLLPVCASPREPIGEREAIQIRALIPAETSVTPPDSTSAAAPASTQAATSAAPTTSTTANAPSSTEATSATSTSAANPTTTHASSASSTTPQAPVTSVMPTTSTNAAGQVITTYVVTTPTMSSGAPSPTNAPNDSSSGGLSTGSIVGLSVSGGIAAVGIILFFVWKFTRKRFADFDDSTSIYVNVSCRTDPRNHMLHQMKLSNGPS